MMGLQQQEKPVADRDRLMGALSYQAPFLIEKLIKERIVETPEEGQALFREVLRYFVLDRLHPDKKWQMWSRRIDEVWHQFVLFTQQYWAFCNRYIGTLLHHFPSNAPGLPAPASEKTSSGKPIDEFLDFRDHYQELYGMPLPELWLDRRSVTPNRRVLVDNTVLDLALEPSDDGATVRCAKGKLFSVNRLAQPALEFILRTPAFYVRELPGDLSDEEKVALVEMLMSRHVLVVAS